MLKLLILVILIFGKNLLFLFLVMIKTSNLYGFLFSFKEAYNRPWNRKHGNGNKN